MIDITVFTPTYNRAYILDTLYRSLQRQSAKDFEWLIIDDGSTDGTDFLVSTWRKEMNPFSIRYYKQDNGGKCRSINRALDLARGRLFFTVDSDDYLTDDAIEKILKWEGVLPKTGNYCGIAGNIGDTPTHTDNKLFSNNYFDGSLLDRYTIVDGERAVVFYTDIHRKYRYPEFDNEKYITEAVTWNRMAHDGYKTRFYNDIIWIFKYQDDGLTRAGNKLFIDNPYGYSLWLHEKASFEGAGWYRGFKLNYNLLCELAPIYGIQKTSDIIRKPYLWCKWVYMLHYALSAVKRRYKRLHE